MRRIVDVYRRRRRFWESVPLRGYLLVLGAVFCIFSIFGFLSDIMLLGQTSWTGVLCARR